MFDAEKHARDIHAATIARLEDERRRADDRLEKALSKLRETSRAPHPNKTNPIADIQAVAWERRNKALELRNRGLTYREVGEHFGVTASRARMLVVGGELQKEWQDKHQKSPFFSRLKGTRIFQWDGLGNRSINCLYKATQDYLPDDVDDKRKFRFKQGIVPIVVGCLTMKMLEETPGCGDSAIYEIVIWFRAKGHEIPEA